MSLPLAGAVDGDEGQVANQQEGGEHGDEAEKAQIAQRVDQPGSHIDQDVFWLEQQVPTVPAREAPQVKPQPAQGEGAERKQPAQDGAQVEVDQALHAAQRSDGQEKPAPGEAHQQADIVPQGHVGAFFQVEKIGQQVRRVGEKGQPDSRRRDQQPPAAGVQEVQAGCQQAESVRDPGQEQVPDQVAVDQPAPAEENPPGVNAQGQQRGEQNRVEQVVRKEAVQLNDGSDHGASAPDYSAFLELEAQTKTGPAYPEGQGWEH